MSRTRNRQARLEATVKRLAEASTIAAERAANEARLDPIELGLTTSVTALQFWLDQIEDPDERAATVANIAETLVRIDAATHHRPDSFVIEPETERMH